MSTTPLVLLGCGSHAVVVVEAARLKGVFEAVVCVDPVGKGDPARSPAPLVRGTDVLRRLFARGYRFAVPALGDNAARRALSEAAVNAGFSLVTVTHPAAVVSPSARLDAGVVVLAGAVVGVRAEIRTGAVINTGATVDHDNDVGAFAFVGPGAHLAGNVRLADEVFVGIGASVVQGATIGRGAVVAAQAAVLGDVPARALVAGVPAAVKRRKANRSRPVGENGGVA